jgi:hypothetical protein
VQFAITSVDVPRRANGPDPEPPLGVHEHESSGDRREHPLAHGLDQGVLHGVLGSREVGPAPDEDTDHRGYEIPQQRLVHSVTVGESARNGRTSSHS